MPSTRPPPLTPDERARELARLLATGLVRLGSSLFAAPSPIETGTGTPSDSDTNELADAAQKSATGTGG